MIETYDGDALDVSALMTAVADLLRRQLCDPTAYAAALPDSMLANRHRGSVRWQADERSMTWSLSAPGGTDPAPPARCRHTSPALQVPVADGE